MYEDIFEMYEDILKAKVSKSPPKEEVAKVSKVFLFKNCFKNDCFCKERGTKDKSHCINCSEPDFKSGDEETLLPHRLEDLKGRR